MRIRPISTLALLVSAACLAAAVPAFGRPTRARPPAAAQPLETVSVDVAPLRDLGLGEVADQVRSVIAQELSTGVGPAGSRVVVRLTGLSLVAYGGTTGGGGDTGPGGGSDFDFLEGDYRILGPSGQVIAERHQVVSSPASSGGPDYVPGAEQRRIAAVSRTFALWLKRAG